jgi:hypothetical protein
MPSASARGRPLRVLLRCAGVLLGLAMLWVGYVTLKDEHRSGGFFHIYIRSIAWILTAVVFIYYGATGRSSLRSGRAKPPAASERGP